MAIHTPHVEVDPELPPPHRGRQRPRRRAVRLRPGPGGRASRRAPTLSRLQSGDRDELAGRPWPGPRPLERAGDLDELASLLVLLPDQAEVDLVVEARSSRRRCGPAATPVRRFTGSGCRSCTPARGRSRARASAPTMDEERTVEDAAQRGFLLPVGAAQVVLPVVAHEQEHERIPQHAHPARAGRASLGPRRSRGTASYCMSSTNNAPPRLISSNPHEVVHAVAAPELLHPLDDGSGPRRGSPRRPDLRSDPRPSRRTAPRCPGFAPSRACRPLRSRRPPRRR